VLPTAMTAAWPEYLHRRPFLDFTISVAFDRVGRLARPCCGVSGTWAIWAWRARPNRRAAAVPGVP